MDGFWPVLRQVFGSKIKSLASWACVIFVVLMIGFVVNLDSIFRFLLKETDRETEAQLLALSRSGSTAEAISNDGIRLVEIDVRRGPQWIADGSLQAYEEIEAAPDGRLSGTVLTKTGKNALINAKVARAMRELQRSWSIQKLALSENDLRPLLEPPPLTYRALEAVDRKNTQAFLSVAIGIVIAGVKSLVN